MSHKYYIQYPAVFPKTCGGKPQLKQIYFSHHHLHRYSFQWRHNGYDSVPNHQPHDCLLNRLFRRRSKKISKLRGIHRRPVNSPHKWPVTRKMFSFDDVIMIVPRTNFYFGSNFNTDSDVTNASPCFHCSIGILNISCILSVWITIAIQRNSNTVTIIVIAIIYHYLRLI